MKTFFTLLGLLAAVAAGAQTTQEHNSLGTQATGRLQQPRLSLYQKTVAPNQIEGKRFGYSGVAVQLAKTDNPLQLINPFATAKFGSGEANTVRAPLVGGYALKVFSFEF